MKKIKSTKSTPLLIITLLITPLLFSLSGATRPDPNHKDTTAKGGGNSGGGGGGGGFFGQGGGFGIPGFDKGWDPATGGGYGYGFGGPKGGYSKGGVIRPSVVCKEKGRCYMKRLICPSKCFSSFSKSGKGYGGGGGGGGCTMDCKKKCIAYC